MTRVSRFDPTATGWVVRASTFVDGREHASWWYGPDSGWGTTSGSLGYGVAVFATKKAAVEACRHFPTAKVEKVADAVAFAIAECDRRKADVLAGTRPDRQEIADANDSAKAYLLGDTR